MVRHQGGGVVDRGGGRSTDCMRLLWCVSRGVFRELEDWSRFW